MKSSIQKPKPAEKASLETGPKDFVALSKEIGYIRARQLLKQVTVKRHQEKIDNVDAKKMHEYRPARLKNAVHQSMTFGTPAIETEIDKIMSNVTKARLHREQESEQDLTEEEMITKNRILDSELSLSRSLTTEELYMSQLNLDHLPSALGETLFLQLSHVRKLACMRNNFTGLLSSKVPQMSAYHLRNLESINLSGNKLVRLCPDVGMMHLLRHINLTDNCLTALPSALGELNKLMTLNLSKNSLSSLSDEFGELKSLEDLNLSSNQITQLPLCLTKLKQLKRLDLSENCLIHLAMLPKHLKTEDMWHKTQDETTAQVVYINILTKERVSNYKRYSGEGITKAYELHEYQPIGTPEYKRRKIWLSICQTHEWEPVLDEESGSVYYRNNVSGDTQWEMPPDLDRLGEITSLEYLNLSYNTIKSCFESLTRLTALQSLLMDSNRMHSLPEQIGNLTSLQVISVKSNELDLLPSSLVQCIALKKINFQDNHLRRLPPEIGTLPHLEVLTVSANSMKSLPYSLGFSKTLKEFTIFDNPLEDPPYREAIKGIDTLMWYLRQRYHIEKNGMPPLMEHHTIGLGEEIIEIYPEFRKRITQAIEQCRSNGTMNLQLLGLRSLPRQILKLHETITELRLDQNQNLSFQQTNGFPTELKSLKLLSLRNCSLVSLDLNISVLSKLNNLDLQENSFQSLPHTITRLKKLKILNYSKNKLKYLSPGYGTLEQLEIFDVNGNHLTTLPQDICNGCKKLKNLNLSSNLLSFLPRNVNKLRNLLKLNIERNSLKLLPDEIKYLHLQSFRCGYNAVERLQDDIFSEDLGRSIEFFSCVENNILELPISLKDIHKTEKFVLAAEFNPLISPPPSVLVEESSILQAYMRVRSARLREIQKLLNEADFVFEPANAKPSACEVLEDGTGFLTPDDIEEFDVAVDEYCNGPLYLCPASGKEIVAALVKLRDARESELYLQVLNATHKAIKKCLNDPLYGIPVIREARRPWGRNGEQVKCYVVSLHCLLRDTPPNKAYQKEGRRAMIRLIEDCMGDTTFPFTTELLKDSLRLYLSAYGQVADNEVMTFDACDCIDERRRKPLYHDPCEKPAVVIVKTIYTDEEAHRREVEEDLFRHKFEEIEGEIRLWLSVSEGHKALAQAVSLKRIAVAEDLELREELRKSELFKQKSLEGGLAKILQRVKLFEQGLGFEMHHILSPEEGQKLVHDAEKKLAKQMAKVKKVEEAVAELDAIAKLDNRGLRRLLTDNLIKKYCYLFYADKLKQLRKEALRLNLRRPWDGEDGIDFEESKNKLIAGAMREAQEAEEKKLLGETVEEPEDENKKKKQKEDDDDYQPEYSWENTDDMTIYDFALYEEYLKETRSMFDKFQALF